MNRRQKFWHKQRYRVRTAAALVLIACTTLTALNSNKVVHIRRPFLLPVVLLPGVLAVGGQVFRIIWTKYQHRVHHVEALCRECAGEILVQLRREGLEVVTIGISVWRVGRRQRMDRVLRHRLTAWPTQSDVTWGPGKGVIGAVVSTRKWQHRYLAPIARKWGTTTDPSKISLAADSDLGLVGAELTEVIGKYAEIAAVPIMEGTQLIGVLSADIPFVRDSTNPPPQLGKRNVRDILEGGARHLAGVLGDR